MKAVIYRTDAGRGFLQAKDRDHAERLVIGLETFLTDAARESFVWEIVEWDAA